MKSMFQLLVDLQSNCSDYGIALYIHILKNVLNIIHIVVPIVLIIMLAINFTQLMMDPDDQKKIKKNSMKNKFIATILVFFIPYLMDLFINLISYSGLVSEDFSLTACYKDSEIIYETIHE